MGADAGCGEETDMQEDMRDRIKVAVDAMGGDHAPREIVKGAVDAVCERKDIQVFLTGQQDAVERELKKYTYPTDQITVVHAEEVIETAEPPVLAIRKKKEVLHSNGTYYGKTKGSGCICFCRQFGSDSGGRTGDRRQNQGRGAAAVSAADSYGTRRFPVDRLRCQCGCETFASGSVCQNGFDLYGICGRRQTS